MLMTSFPDKPVKFRDLCLDHSREIPAEAVGDGIFTVFSAITSDLK